MNNRILTALPQMVEPNRIVETIKAVRVDACPQGGWVVDMGKNFTGWLEIALRPAATRSTITLEYSDQMERDTPAPGIAAAPAGARGGHGPASPSSLHVQSTGRSRRQRGPDPLSIAVGRSYEIAAGTHSFETPLRGSH
jgi:hypothetical protein